MLDPVESGGAGPRTAGPRRQRHRPGGESCGGQRRADDRRACLGGVPAAIDAGPHRTRGAARGGTMSGGTQMRDVRLTVNGKAYEGRCEPRLLLVDFLRDNLSLTGTHAGCEHGVCGACTILYNGEAARSCIMFAVQADGADLVTVEGLADNGTLHPLQQAFHEHHALQCGFCTPGMLITALDYLKINPSPTED